MQYAQPATGGSTSAPAGKGHGPFSEEDINQIMAETGYEYQQVCDDIDRTGARTKEELYPNFYSGEGIQPQGQMAGSGAVPGGEMAMATPTDDGATAAAAAAPPVEGLGLSPEALQAMHDAMAPAAPITPGKPQGGNSPAWRKRLREMET